MSPMLGLDKGVPLAGLPDTNRLKPTELMRILREKKVLDDAAMRGLGQYLELVPFAFVFHPVLCRKTPWTRMALGGEMPWTRYGSVYAWAQKGTVDPDTKCLGAAPDGMMPDAVWLEFCLAGA